MVIAAVALFLIGALFGIYMFGRHLRRRAIPGWAAMAHGTFGAVAFGLVLLVMVTMPGMAFLPQAIGVLIGAVVLGVVNLVFHVRRVRHRTILIVMHAMTAVIGVGTLAYAGVLGMSAKHAPAPLIPAPAFSGPIASAAPAPEASVLPAATSTQAVIATATATAPAAAAPAPTTPAAFPTGPAWTDRALTFDSASTSLDAHAKESLAGVVSDLQSHPEITLVEVQGHSDERGDAATNARLARTPAVSALEFLAGKGIARSRLRAAGYGTSCPADPACRGPAAPATCHDGSSFDQDRRVTLVVLDSGGAHFRGKSCESGAVASRR